MTYIVKQKVKGKDYYYLRKSFREGKKVISKNIAYLGKSKEEAEKKAKKIIWKEKLSEKMKNIPEIKKTELIKKEISIEELSAFCKRKGFAYPSSEIYGGLAGFWDYGHLGTLLKKNLENLWKKYFLGLDENFFEIETSEIMPEKVFIASGHLKNFTDIAAKCKKGHIERADHLLEKNLSKKFDGLKSEKMMEIISQNKIPCSTCKAAIEYVGPINMMFPLELGIGDSITKAFLRPETAQSPYVNFKTQNELTRGKLPMGLALIGRAYRNELSPRNMLLRQRAFTQAELQIFFNPSKIDEHPDFEEIKDYELLIVQANQRDKGLQIVSCIELAKKIPKFYVYYLAKVQEFYLNILKFPKEKFRFYELNDQEKAFYNKYHFDIEVELGKIGWTEIGGIHYRTNHDLKGHQEISKQNISVVDEETKEKFIPHVLELSFGIDRNFQAILDFSYFYDEKRQNIVLNLNPNLSPIKIAIFPIVKREEFEKIAKKISKELKENFQIFYDKSASIGRRYSRQDEIGTPFCITIDEDSIKNKMVTIRERNSAEQIKVKIKDIQEIMIKAILKNENILNLGKIVDTRKK